MKRKSLIELTPLLDIILILLFAFIINAQGAQANQTEKFEKEKASLNDEINKLENINKENEVLNNENLNLEEKLLWEREQRIEQANDLREAAKALKKISSGEDALLKLFQYEMLMNRFYVLDIEIIGFENEIFINGVSAKLYITREETNSKDLRENKINAIYDLLEDTFLNRNGGDEMVLLTLIVRDSEVYQYAYTLMKDTIRSFKNGHNDTKIYTYEFTSY